MRATASWSRCAASGGAAWSRSTWDEALDEAEQLLRGAEGRIVTALSGSETVEQAYALGRLLREGLGAHTALMPEECDESIRRSGSRSPRSRAAELVVVIGDDPVVDRAPIVDLWLKAARRRGAEVVTIGPTGTVPRRPGDGPQACGELTAEDSELGGRLRAAERAILIWSGPGGAGGAEIARLASAARLRRQGGQRRLPPPRHAERARRRRGVGGRVRRRGREPRADRRC